MRSSQRQQSTYLYCSEGQRKIELLSGPDSCLSQSMQQPQLVQSKKLLAGIIVTPTISFAGKYCA